VHKCTELSRKKHRWRSPTKCRAEAQGNTPPLNIRRAMFPDSYIGKFSDIGEFSTMLNRQNPETAYAQGDQPARHSVPQYRQHGSTKHIWGA
jgi:hypothetical protein